MNMPIRPVPKEITEYESLDAVYSLAQRDADNRNIETDLETDQLDEQALQLHLSGRTYRQIGLEMGFSKSWAYVRVQRALMNYRSLFPDHEADVRDEAMLALRQGIGPVIENAAQGDLKSFRALNQYANTMMRLLKIGKPTGRERTDRVKLLRDHWECFKIAAGPARPSAATPVETASEPEGGDEEARGQECGQTTGQDGGQPLQPEAALTVTDAENKKPECVDSAAVPIQGSTVAAPESQLKAPDDPAAEAIDEHPAPPGDCSTSQVATSDMKTPWPTPPAACQQEYPDSQFNIEDPDEDLRRAAQRGEQRDLQQPDLPENEPPEPS